MKHYFSGFLFLLYYGLCFGKHSSHTFDHYNVQLTITDTTVTVNTRCYLKKNAPENTKTVFELNKAYTGITVSEKFTVVDTAYKKLITVNTPRPSSYIDFSYTAPLDSLGIAHPNTHSYSFLDKDVIPLLHSQTVYRPFTYEIDYTNQHSVYAHIFSNAYDIQDTILRSDEPTDRLIIHLSKDKLLKHTHKDLTLYMDKKIDADSVTFMTTNASQVMSFYNDFFGESKKQMTALTIFMNDSFAYSFFSRKHFIYMNTSGSKRKKHYLLAHELAHYWCNTASVYNYTPDAFLNEGLAEYMFYIWYRDQFGEEKFKDLIKRKQNDIRDLNLSIMDISYDTMSASGIQSKVLYIQGALICYQLERKLGQEQFKTLLATIVRLNIASLVDVEQLLKDMYGKDSADFFHSLINTPLHFSE